MTESEALTRPYVIGDQTCAMCGERGEILYQSYGGWWCRAHEDIPERVFLRNQKPLLQGIRDFIKYHS